MSQAQSPLAAKPHWYRGFIQGKTRVVLAWVFALALAFSAKEAPTWPGIVLGFIGASLRFWASGFLRKDTRPAVGGPYSIIRNPLYLGTYLLALGTALSTQNYWLLGIITVLFAAVYHYIILDEETKLARLFGEAYAKYCDLVPRFFPRVWPPLGAAPREALQAVNPDPEAATFSWDLAWKNRAYEAYASWIGLFGAVWVASLIWAYIAQ